MIEQLTLKEVIEKIESFDLVIDYGDNEDKNISFGFGRNNPSKVDSWRGSYSEPSVEYSDKSITAKNFLAELKDSIGREVTGYKGGEFILREDSYLWVDNYGASTCTGIFDVIDDGWRLIIQCAYFEY